MGDTPRKTSRRHPLLRSRPQGVWYPDLVGVVPHYFKTQESFDRRQASCRAQIIRLNADPNFKGRMGVKDGWANCKPLIARSAERRLEEAGRIVDHMVETKIIEVPDEQAREALEFAISLVRANSHMEKTSDRLNAAALVLKYTKSAPAAKSEVTLNKAEDFLQALAKEANADRPDDTSTT